MHLVNGENGMGPESPMSKTSIKTMELVMSQSNYDPSYSILRQAFEQAKPEIDAVSDGDLITVTTGVVAAATTGQGVYPEVVALRPLIVQELSSFKISRLDNLKTYGLALLYANGD